jgi:hypothetical protein
MATLQASCRCDTLEQEVSNEWTREQSRNYKGAAWRRREWQQKCMTSATEDEAFTQKSETVEFQCVQMHRARQ